MTKPREILLTSGEDFEPDEPNGSVVLRTPHDRPRRPFGAIRTTRRAAQP